MTGAILGFVGFFLMAFGAMATVWPALFIGIIVFGMAVM